jgi:hypothetical protein
MRLAELVARYPNTRLATPADNARILDFFERTPMHTSAFDVQYRRRPDFFRLLRYQADRAFVILTEDNGGNIRGLATASLRPGWADGHPTTIGYLGDLRVKLDRQFSGAWRRLFADLVTCAPQVEELADCTHWFTTVIDGNRAALAALGSGEPSDRSGRRIGRSRQPSLVPIGPFTMRNLIMRLPLAGRSRPRGPWQVCGAHAPDTAALTDFFEEENRHVPLGFRGELPRRLLRWEGLSIADFAYVVDDRGLAACVAPWSPDAAKQTVVSRVPAILRLVGRGARALPSPPVRVPEPGEPLRMPYLTHLTFASRLTPDERAGMFRSLLDHLFDRWRGADWHCVALCDFDAWNLGRALRGFVQQTVPITVYAVVPPGHDPGTGPRPCTSPPAFEMAMV